jgi:hypothetical protein
MVEHRPEDSSTQRAADIARKDIRRRNASPFRGIDDFLYEHERGYADQSHTEAHDERSHRGYERRHMGCQHDKEQGAERLERRSGQEQMP